MLDTLLFAAGQCNKDPHPLIVDIRFFNLLPLLIHIDILYISLFLLFIAIPATCDNKPKPSIIVVYS